MLLTHQCHCRNFINLSIHSQSINSTRLLHNGPRHLCHSLVVIFHSSTLLYSIWWFHMPICPTSLDPLTDLHKIIPPLQLHQRLPLARHATKVDIPPRPKHAPSTSPRQLPRTYTPLKIPFIHRIILSAAPHHTARETGPHHGVEYYIRDTTGALGAAEYGEFV